MNTTERNNIMSEIFGDDGLVSADNTFNFEGYSQLEATEYTWIDPEVIRHGRLSVYKFLQCITFNRWIRINFQLQNLCCCWYGLEDKKNRKKKTNCSKTFLKNSKKRTIDNVATSSNGLYKVPNKAQKIARKPGQVKRSRSEKKTN